MLTGELYKAISANLSEDHTNGPAVIGYELFRNGSVTPKRLFAQKRVYGDVIEGRSRHTVGLKLAADSLDGGSKCSCGRKPYCCHIAAFFYQIAMESGHAIEPPASAKQNLEEATPEPPVRSGFEWRLLLNKEASRFIKNGRETGEQDFMRFMGAIGAQLRISLSPELQPLAELAASILFLRKAEEQWQKSGYYWGAPASIEPLRDCCTHAMFEAAGSSPPIEQHSEEAVELVQLVLDFIRRPTFEEPLASTRVNWIHIYRYIWWHAAPLWLYADEEWDYLQGNWKSLGRSVQAAVTIDYYSASNPNMRVRENIVSAHLHQLVMRGDDEAASEWLLRLDRQRWASTLMPYFEVFAVSSPERMLDWLRELQSQAASAKSEFHDAFARWYCGQWNVFWEASGKADRTLLEEALQVLLSLLPHSYHAYQQLLFESDDLEGWTDLQLALGGDAMQLESAHVRHVEKARPDLLLPIYHATIEQYVAQRNRDAYKIAVRYLAKLPKLYKKLKRQGEWVEFLERFTAKYSRLRALQEEMQRRKGIS